MEKIHSSKPILTPEQAKLRLERDVAAAHERYENELKRYEQYGRDWQPPQLSAAKQRALDIKALRDTGLTFQVIGQRLGISKSRASQLCQDAEKIKNAHGFKRELSTRAYNVCRNACYSETGEWAPEIDPQIVATAGQSALMKMYNSGAITVSEIAGWLRSKGLTLAP